MASHIATNQASFGSPSFRLWFGPWFTQNRLRVKENSIIQSAPITPISLKYSGALGILFPTQPLVPRGCGRAKIFWILLRFLLQVCESCHRVKPDIWAAPELLSYLTFGFSLPSFTLISLSPPFHGLHCHYASISSCHIDTTAIITPSSTNAIVSSAQPS
jgi:hypothetical protein